MPQCSTKKEGRTKSVDSSPWAPQVQDQAHLKRANLGAAEFDQVGSGSAPRQSENGQAMVVELQPVVVGKEDSGPEAQSEDTLYAMQSADVVVLEVPVAPESIENSSSKCRPTDQSQQESVHGPSLRSSIAWQVGSTHCILD